MGFKHHPQVGKDLKIFEAPGSACGDFWLVDCFCLINGARKISDLKLIDGLMRRQEVQMAAWALKKHEVCMSQRAHTQGKAPSVMFVGI